MTTRYKTRAFVFKKSDRNESDRVFSVFSDDFGRLEIFAKAIRKNVSKLRSGMDIFFMTELEFIQGKNRKTLTDAVVSEKFGDISQSLHKFKIANRISGVLDEFLKGEEKDGEIFNLLNDVFRKLDDKKLKADKYETVYYYFLWNLLFMLGYLPEVNECNICRGGLNPYNVYFSLKEGGVICKKCLGHDAGAEKINSDIIKILRLILKKEGDIIFSLKVGPASQKLFEHISDDYCAYILSGHSFKNVL